MIWIPVLEKKPADLQQVLIFDFVNEYVIGYYHQEGAVFIGSVDGARITNARFWRPLPELPVQCEQNILELQNAVQVIGDTV